MQSRNPNNIPIIDVSHHQGIIDWEEVVFSGVDGALIKASEGVGYVDPMFYKYVEDARAVGLKIGFYHYARPETGNTAKQEAESFLSIIKDLPADFPHALDVEGDAADIGIEQLTDWAYDWLTEVQQLSEHRVMLYTGAYFARDYLGTKLGKWPLWVAHYGVDTPMSNNTWDKWAVFQFTSTGRIPGISGNVDVNEMDLDYWSTIVGVKPKMEAVDANKIIEFLKASWGIAVDNASREECRRLANLLRVVSGQPEE